MFCKYCGYEYQNENVRFCPSCGRSLENEVVVVENVEPEETQEVTPVQQQVVYQQVPPLNNIPVNTNGNTSSTTTTQDPNTGQTIVYVTNEVKKDEGGFAEEVGKGCLGCLGWIVIIFIVLAVLGSCTV